MLQCYAVLTKMIAALSYFKLINIQQDKKLIKSKLA